MGVELFGIFSTAISLGFVVMTVMDFGLDSICTRTIARSKYDLFRPIVQLKTIMIGIGIVIFCISFYLFNQLGYAVPLLCIGFCLFSTLNFIYAYFRGKELMHLEIFLLFNQRALLVLSGLLLMSFYPTILSASFCFFFSHLITIVLAAFLISNSVHWETKHFYKFDIASLSKTFKDVFPLAIVSIMGVLYFRIDALLLAMYSGMPAVGLYQGSFKLIEGVALVGSILIIVTFPMLSRYGEHVTIRFKNLYYRIFKLYIIAGLIVTFCVYFFSDGIVDIVFGDAYQESSSLLKVLILSVPASYPGHLVTQSLIALDCQKTFMYIILSATIINIGFNIILIPKYGAFAAAWTMVCTTYFIAIACTLFINAHLKKMLRFT